MDEDEPARRRISPGSIPDGFFPDDAGSTDEASRYMHRRSVERLERTLIQPPPVHDPSIGPPPFRRKRLRRYEALIEAKAAALIERGEIEVLTNGGVMKARLIMFADGTGVFEHEHSAAYGDSAGIRRLDGANVAAEWVALALESALLSAQVRPIAGQEI